MTAYPFVVHKEKEGIWGEFPDLEGCVVQEESLEETLETASLVLNDFLQSLDGRKITINPPSEISGDNVYYIEPELKTAFAITLKQEREKMGLTQLQVAERMGVKWAFYQRIENPRISNPTLSTIEKVSKAFGKKFFLF